MSHPSSDLLSSAPGEEQGSAIAGRNRVSRTVFYTYLALFLAILCAYAGVAGCDFINADDPGYIHQNPFVQTGFSWANVQSAFTSFFGSLWIPLTWVSFMVDVSLFGLKPMWFHIENLVFHAVTALLLLHGLHRATGRFWPSAIVAALFGLHPINVESVAWITERKNVLCAFFWVLSTNAYLRYGATGRKRSYCWALLWFAMALMSKPMAVTLPGVLVLLDLWPLRRDLSRWRQLLIEKLPFVLLTAGACLLALSAPQDTDTLVSKELLPLGSRLSNAVISYVMYLRDFFWPAHLAAFYPHPYYAQPLLAAISVTILLGITGVAVYFYRSRPYLLVGWLWFLGVLVPMIGLVQIGAQARADRFTYLAQIGIFVAVVWFVADMVSGRRQRFVAAFTGAALLGLASRTAVEVQCWTDTATLFERAIAQAGPSAFSHFFAGKARLRQGDNARAAEHFAAAMQEQPEYNLWRDYGRALKNLGRFEDAAHAFTAAIRHTPKDAECRFLLARTLEEMRLGDAAITQFQEVIRLEPRAAQAHEALARLLEYKGLKEEAEQHRREAAQIRSKQEVGWGASSESDRAKTADH